MFKRLGQVVLVSVWPHSFTVNLRINLCASMIF